MKTAKSEQGEIKMQNTDAIKIVQGMIFKLLNDANKKDSWMNPEQKIQFQLLMKISKELVNGNN